MKFALLIARQRSGTGALGSILDKHPQLAYLGEIFHPDNIGEPTNYFTFLKNLVASDPDRAMPWHSQTNFDEYVDAIQPLFLKQKLILDIKYSSLHNINLGWQEPLEPSHIIKYAISLGVPIIHLTRRNLVKVFVSGLLADINKVWHTTDTKSLKVQSVKVDPEEVLYFIKKSEEEYTFFNSWLSNSPRLVSLEYEDMLDANGSLNLNLAKKFVEQFDIEDFVDLSPHYVKQAPSDLSKSIENYEEVKQALSGTEYHWMLEE